MENIKETIAKLEKGLDNPYITDDIKVKISEKIAELKTELEPKPAPIPEPIAVVETKVEPTLDDLTKRLGIVNKMAAKNPALKARVKIIEKMIEKAKKNQQNNDYEVVFASDDSILISDGNKIIKWNFTGEKEEFKDEKFFKTLKNTLTFDVVKANSFDDAYDKVKKPINPSQNITETIGYKIVKTLGGFGDGLSDEKAILDSYSDIIPQLTRAATEPFDRVELQKLIVKITGNPDVSSDLEILRKHKVLDLDKKEIEDEKVSDETIKAAEFYFSDKYNLTKYDLYEDLVRYVQMEKDFNAKKLTPKDIIGTGIKPQYAREIASKWIKDRLELTKYLIKNFDDKNQLTETQKQEQHFDEPTSEKLYSIQNNIGKSKYVVNYHDGVKKHKDGSPFYDIEIFKNKKQLENFVKKLEKEGYKEKYENGGEITSDYYIHEGYDHFKNKPLFRVESSPESDDEYVGEWHDNRPDAQKELDGLNGKGKSVNYEVFIDMGKKGKRIIADFTKEQDAKNFVFEYGLKHPNKKLGIDTVSSDFIMEEGGEIPYKLHYVTYYKLPNGKWEVPSDSMNGIKYAIFNDEQSARDYIAENKEIKAKGGEVAADKMYNFLKDDLEKLETAINEGDKEQVETFFSYWNHHLDKLKTETNDRMYNFLKDDLEKLENAINEGDKEEVETFFSYWNHHLEKLKMAKGGELEGKYTHTYMMLSRLQSDNDYFLGFGYGNPSSLWAGNVDDQIDEMKKLWNSLPKNAKPEWLSMQDILDYELKMKNYNDKFEKGGQIRKRRTKNEISQAKYQKEVDAYKWYVVNIAENHVITGFEIKEDATEALNDYDGDKNYKVVSKKHLELMGIENPNEKWKTM